MPKWSLGHSEYERVEFEVFGPPANDCGYDWTRAHAHAAAGGFQAEVDLMMLTSELCGTAAFSTMENQLGLEVTIENRGDVSVTGHMKALWVGNTLTIALTEFDQTYLQRTLAELNEALSELDVGS